jgi:acetyl-CoA acetyltransferase
VIDGEENYVWARDRCAIVGIGSTEFSRDSGRSVLSLATEASLAALEDAGLEPADVDGIVRCDHDHVSHNDLAASLGIANLTYWGQTGPGGGAPCAMVGQAAAAVLSGLATTVLLYRSLNGRSEARFGQGKHMTRGAQVVGGNTTYDEFFLPFGLITAGQTFALMAQRHMATYGTTPEQLGHIALACREHAHGNPRSQMGGKPMTMDDYLAARMISTPLRLFDYCLETDGASAVVVTATERARDLRQKPVLIRAQAGGCAPDTRPGMMFPVVMREDITDLPGRSAAATLWKRAGLGPEDVDVAQFYDCFTISVLLQLEAFGFCQPGEGGPFAASGALRPGGRLPINTGGGHLSEGYIHGMNHIVEAARQLRGESTGQVADAETCLVTGGPLPTGTSVLLRRA